MANALQIVNRFYPNVKSVKDSHKSILIEVSKKDTQSRAVKNHKECALAVACKRMADVDGAIICVKSAYLIKGNTAIRYHNPESVSREVTSFDRNAGFEPGVYFLSSVPPSSRLGTLRKYGKKTSKGRKANYHRTENIRELGA